MSKLERMELKKKYPISSTVKLIMLVAIVMGFYIRGCARKKAAEAVKISYVEISEVTSGNIDIKFVVENRADVELTKAFLIRVFMDDGEELASKITNVTLQPRSRKKYLKMLTKFNIVMSDASKVSHATVELYEANFFDFSN